MDKYPPTPDELTQYIHSHDLTSRQVAEMLHVSSSVVRKWMSGKLQIPYTVWFTLKAQTENR